MSRARLAWVGVVVVIAAAVAFVAYIAVAGLGQASELAAVVSALFALGGLALSVFGRRGVPVKRPIGSIKTAQWTRQAANERSVTTDGRSVTNSQRRSETNSQKQSVTRTATPKVKAESSKVKTAPSIIGNAVGTPPWTIKGHGLIYKVISVKSTISKSGGEESRRSITVTAEVTRTELKDFHSLEYGFSDQESGLELEEVPFESRGRESHVLNEPSKLITVLWDTDPPTTTLKIVLHDFYWSAKKNLILKDVPVLPVRN